MYMLRLAIAPCVESIILLDQLLYLKEQGIIQCVCTDPIAILIMAHHRVKCYSDATV